jgi:hypothetical protein
MAGFFPLCDAKIVNFTEVAHYEDDVFHLETHSGLGNVACKSRALMEDAHDINAVGDEAVKQEVRAAGNFLVARAYVRAVLSHRRTRRYGLDALPKVAGVPLCLVKSPAVGRVIPNIAKVCLSAL